MPLSRFIFGAYPHIALAAIVAAAHQGPVHAQFRDGSDPLFSFTRSAVDTRGSEAVTANASQLGFLESWHVAYVHQQGAPLDRLSNGDGLYGAIPLFFGLSLGAAFTHVRPAESSARPDRGSLALALSWARDPTLSFGLGIRQAGSTDRALDMSTFFDLSAAWRPSPVWSFTAVARAANAVADFATAGELPTTGLLSVGLRPFATDALTLAGTTAMDTEGIVGLRGQLRGRITHVGYLTAAIEAEDLGGENHVTASGALEVHWGHLGAHGGVLAQQSGPIGWQAGATLGGKRDRGLPLPDVAMDLTPEGLGPRGFISLVRSLEKTLVHPRAQALLFRPRGTGMGLAYAQEVRQLFGEIRKAHKPVVCHLDAGSGSEYYACAGANRVYADPAGGVRLQGGLSRALLLGETLERIGVRAEFVRTGQYKSAPEMLTHTSASNPARHQRQELLQDVTDDLVTDLARDRKVSVPKAKTWLDTGPHLTVEALEYGLLDGAKDEWDMADTLHCDFGGRLQRMPALDHEYRRRWGRPRSIGVVVVDGDIVDGDNVDVPFLGVHMTGGRTLVKTIDGMTSDPLIAAIVLRIDSPGGSALASDQVHRAVLRAKKKKPVLATFGAVAASGGYYIGAAASEIWANPATVTGSIGVFAGKVDWTGLAKKLGVHTELIQAAPNAGIESPWVPITAAQRDFIAIKLRHWYRVFVERVAKARGKLPSEIHRVAQGRVWSGRRAHRLGLVDHLGGLREALQRARALTGLDEGAPLRVAPFRPSTLLDYVLEGGTSTRVPMPGELRALLQYAWSLQRNRGVHSTMARLPWALPLAISP